MGVFIILAIIVISIMLVINRSDIKLRRIEITNDSRKTAPSIEVDTIESYPLKSLYLVNIIHNGTFGRFSMSYGVIKKLNNGKQIVYEFPKHNEGDLNRVSKGYIEYFNYHRETGYTIVGKYNEQQILKGVDSAAGLPDPPRTIVFKEGR
jgi:hypothetical protein